jgi:iron complex outermembrane receptor protein
MGLAAAALVTTTGGARAQEIEEITVTAQRRSSALQDVPIAITVMTDKEIAIANFSDTRSLAAEIPNFQISSPWGAANTGLFIRGIGNADVNATANAKIGTYQDQVFTGLQVGQNFQLFDLERIEVLKGPQGTLYGKNTGLPAMIGPVA